jgi:glycosyltransferase involved in cell wall biosynthesis
MRIGFVTGEYPPMQGGVGAFTRELARAMVKMGHQVYVHTKIGAEGSSEPGITVQASVERWAWSTVREVRAWAQGFRLDVVNVQFQTAAFNMHPAIHLLPRSVDTIPVVVTFHDLRVPYLFPKAGLLRDYSIRLLARESDLAIATDRQDEARLLDAWNIESVARIPIGSNVSTVPPPDYTRDSWRERIDVSPDALLIGYFGFLNATKGGLELVEAQKLLVSDGLEAHLLMIGGRVGVSDPTNAAYGQLVEDKIAALGLKERVHWTGFADDLAVSGYFRMADLVALPYVDGASLRRGTLMAALAHGQAIVTTQPAVPTPELTDPPSVMTIPTPPQPKELADAIGQMWRSPEERGKLEQAARQASEQFTWESIARRTLAEFVKLTE